MVRPADLSLDCDHHLMTGAPRLGAVEPRERAGSQTGRKYEYQYERTARAALELLANGTSLVSVYCDWHDDFVVEAGDPPTRYVFHQVKGRKLSQGPWTFRELFGVAMREEKSRARKLPEVNDKAVVPRMLLHHENFGANCAGLAFITNSGLDVGLEQFLQHVSASTDPAGLPEKTRNAFSHLARAYVDGSPSRASSEVELYKWIQGLNVYTNQGQIEGADNGILELADIVVDYSEIDLSLRQTKQIAREVVGLVRGKVSHCSTVVPAPDEKLRKDKGVVIDELLGILSLSSQAYAELKAGTGNDAIKTLSRLQRFCRQKGLEDHIVTICGFKAEWDLWRTVERHGISSVDYFLLEGRANEVLRQNLSIQQIVAEARIIAKEFYAVSSSPLEAEHVLGLIFSLAAQAEASNQNPSL